MSSATFRINKGAGTQVIRAAERALDDGIEHLGEHAERTAPIEEGTMIRSGQASRDGLTAAWSYDTKYAKRQHEDTRYRHDAGRRAKWLQLTFAERSSTVLTYIARKMREAI